MQNQVDAARKNGIKVALLNSTISQGQRQSILSDLRSLKPTTKLLYVTPELIATKSFNQEIMGLINRNQLAQVVVDEAHCISDWGMVHVLHSVDLFLSSFFVL